MKKYILLLVITSILILIVLSTPRIIQSNIPTVNLIKTKTTIYGDHIMTSGIIDQTGKKDVIYEFPIATENILVSVGDKISQGDLIATINKDLTQQAIIDLIAVASDKLNDQVVSVFGNQFSNIDIIKNSIPSEIRAPTSGTVTNLNLNTGSITTPNDTLITISDLSQLNVKLSVNERDISKIKLGQQVSISTDAVQNKLYSGTITQIFPSARKKISGTTQETVVDIIASIDNDNTQDLKPGFSASGKILIENQKEICILPYESILQDDEGIEYVYIYHNKKAIRKNIKTGIETENGIEIIEGISKSDKILLNPSVIKTDNSIVNINNKYNN